MVKSESADADRNDPNRIVFFRSAKFDDASAWLWRYEEEDGVVCFVTVVAKDNGTTIIGLAEPNALGPEQFIGRVLRRGVLVIAI